jgi:methyl-accepting chemotaxis protein
VKALARQSAEATGRIAQQVSTIQTDSQQAIEAFSSISGVVNRVNALQSTIASAVEEQSATTQEMARAVQETASASHEIARALTGLAEDASSASSGAAQGREAATELARLASALTTEIGKFQLAAG